jgi:hypothetical protein
MDSFGENPRGIHATGLLTGQRDFTIASLISNAFDSYLPAFARQIPILVADYDALPASDPLKPKLAGQIALLRHWDYRWGITSIPTSLAVFWGDTLWDSVSKADTAEGLSIYDYMAEKAGPAARLQALVEASDRLEKDFGSWGVPWGEINRFQRSTATSCSRSMTASQAFPCRSSPRAGARSLRLARIAGQVRSATTAPAATVLSRQSSSAPESRPRHHRRRRKRSPGLATLQ